MVPIYRDEIGDDSWEALELLAAFLRLLGFNATAYLRQIWAVGYYAKNRKCPRERAQYCGSSKFLMPETWNCSNCLVPRASTLRLGLWKGLLISGIK